MKPRLPVRRPVGKVGAGMGEKGVGAFRRILLLVIDPETDPARVVVLNPVIERHIADCRPVLRHTSRKTEMMTREKYHLRIPDVRFI